MNSYKSDAVILTAVVTETNAVMQVFDSWKRRVVLGDAQKYYETILPRGDRELHVLTAQQKVMGMTADTLLATKVIEIFRPRYLILSGIAAGTGDEAKQMMGDVLVPDVVWDYSTGKYVGPDESEIRFGDVGFLPRPMSIRLHDEMKRIVENTVGMPDNECRVHIGPLACGSSVVANANFVDKQIRGLYPHTIGLDMESYAVFFAAENVLEPRPMALVAKSICDFASEKKDDRFQKFAAYTSAQYVRYLLEKHLPFS